MCPFSFNTDGRFPPCFSNNNTIIHLRAPTALACSLQGLAHIQEQVQLKPATLNNKLHQRLKLAVHKATQKMDKVGVLCFWGSMDVSWKALTRQ